MTTLAEEGFLADEAAAVIVTVREKYAIWLAEIRGLNALLVKSQYELEAHPESAKEMMCAALYVRSLTHAQAAVVLLERGMAAPARALTRCALEGLFALSACSRDYKAALAYMDADQFDRKRRTKYLGEIQSPSARALVDPSELQAIRAKAEQTIKELDASDLRVRGLAKQAGLEDLYLTAYAFLSGAVHSSVADLDQHLEADSSGRASALLTSPVVDDLDGLLLILGETMGSILRAASSVFAFTTVEACEQHMERLYELGKRELANKTLQQSRPGVEDAP